MLFLYLPKDPCLGQERPTNNPLSLYGVLKNYLTSLYFFLLFFFLTISYAHFIPAFIWIISLIITFFLFQCKFDNRYKRSSIYGSAFGFLTATFFIYLPNIYKEVFLLGFFTSYLVIFLCSLYAILDVKIEKSLSLKSFFLLFFPILFLLLISPLPSFYAFTFFPIFFLICSLFVEHLFIWIQEKIFRGAPQHLESFFGIFLLSFTLFVYLEALIFFLRMFIKEIPLWKKRAVSWLTSEDLALKKK